MNPTDKLGLLFALLAAQVVVAGGSVERDPTEPPPPLTPEQEERLRKRKEARVAQAAEYARQREHELRMTERRHARKTSSSLLSKAMRAKAR